MGAVISYFDFFERVILGAVIEAQTIQLVTLTLISFILVSVMALVGLMIWFVIAPLKKLANFSQHFFLQQDSQYSEDLTEHELIYRAAFSQAAVGIARVDISGRWLEVNQNLCDIIGYSKEELLQTNFQAITHPEDLKKDLIMARRVIDDEIKTYSIEKRLYSKDGRIVWVNLSVSLVRDSRLKPKYFISIVEDISDRKLFERELEESKWQREELIRGRDLASEAGGISNWSWDMINDDLSWDERMYEIYGIDRERTDLDYDVWRGQVHPDDIDNTEVKIKRTIEDLVPFSAEFRIYNKQTGDIRWVKAAADVVSKNRQAIKMFGVNLDITDERLTQIALKKEGQLARQASEAKSNFLAVMSHEIRTPMNSVIGMIDLLRETSLSQEQERMTATVRDSSFSLLEIINGILDFSKIESGQMELDLVPTSLLAIIERSAEALWGHAISHNVKLYILPELQIPERLLIDPVRIRQIIVNILGNAIKFSQDRNKQGVVFIRTSLVCTVDGELNVGIEVIDNGIGMSKNQQGKLFQPFTQADSSTTRKYGGTGLGLTITKSFVDMMNGYIDVESELYKGSSFNVVIPIEKDKEHTCELSNVDVISANVLVALYDESLVLTVCNVLEQVKCNFYNIDDLNVNFSNGQYIDRNIDTVIVDRLATVDEIMIFIGLSNMERPNVLLLDDEISSDRCGVEGNTYIVRSQPLKPSELIYALSIMSGSESAVFARWQDKEFCREHAGMLNLGDVDNRETLILVAEDQPTNREVIGQQLSKLGYNFEMANDGIEALGKWRTGRFHILLTDCHMPNMDGFELTSAIRNEEKMLSSGHRTTIIAITANALVGEADHCLESGMDDYVSKPVELNKLRKTLSVWVRNQYLLLENSDEPPFVLEADDNVYDISPISQQESPVNFDSLSNILGTSDKEVINTILSSFWSSLESDYDDVLNAIHLHDGESLRRAAHTAKGASNSSAIIKLGQIFKDMEMFAIDEDWDEIENLEQELRSEIERLNEFLTKEKIIEGIFDCYETIKPIYDNNKVAFSMIKLYEYLNLKVQKDLLESQVKQVDKDIKHITDEIGGLKTKYQSVGKKHVSLIEKIISGFNGIFGDVPNTALKREVQKLFDTLEAGQLEKLLDNLKDNQVGIQLDELKDQSDVFFGELESDLTEQQSKLAKSGGNKLEGITIVVADDQEFMLKIISTMLEPKGIHVEKASNGVEAILKSKLILPDLVILDIDMPIMNGIETLAAMKNVPQLADMPVIMLTSYTDIKNFQSCLDLGANDYIVKPTNADTMLKKISSVLN